jgi:D-sedoheptulose 7-phosphate isomerase
VPSIEAAFALMRDALSGQGKLLFCGNGGSAADAQHIAAELVVRMSRAGRRAFAAVALTTDTSILTAGGNDLGFERIFSRQVEALGAAGDVLVAISTSGKSPNVVAAVRVARERGLGTVGFLGGKGGELGGMVDVAVTIPSDDTQRIQEGHITVGHILCGLLEEALSG